MNKTPLILKFFQKVDKLTVNQSDYRKTITSLFNWLVAGDEIKTDITSQLLKFSSEKTANIISHEPVIVAGIEEINYLIKQFTQLSFKPLLKDGGVVKKHQTIACIQGSANEILAYERTILNFLQRMSGIATQTNRLIKIVNNPLINIAATRKTPWGTIDKKAVAVGGGLTHRLNLKDGILIKDNHLKLTSIPLSLKQIIPQIHHQLIEVEVRTLKETSQTINVFTQLNKNNYLCIMFDNFSASKINTAITKLNNDFVIYEASGGINQSNLFTYAKTCVDIISLGALTHSCRAADLSLEIN